MSNNVFSPALKLAALLGLPAFVLIAAYNTPKPEKPDQSVFIEQQLAASIMETKLVEAMNSIPNVQDRDLPVEAFNNINRRFILMNNTNGDYIRSLQDIEGVPLKDSLKDQMAFSLSEENRNLLGDMLEVVRASGKPDAVPLTETGNFWLESCVDDVVAMTAQNRKDFQTALKPFGSVPKPAKQVATLPQ